jgi:hypothetical protein
MALMLAEAGVRHDAGETVAFAAHRIRPVHAQVGILKQICDQLARRYRLIEFIAAFQNVGPLGTMRTIRPGTPKLAIVVAVVAVRAEYLRSYRAPLRYPIEIQHRSQQAGLR